MSEPVVREGTVHDAKKLASNLREADRREIEYKSGLSPAIVLTAPFARRTPRKVFSIVRDAQVLGMFGVSMIGLHPQHGPVGTPWLVGTDELTERYARRFIREAPLWLEEISRGYGLLENYAYAGNRLHIRWLKKLGFELVERIEQFGIAGKPFYRFRRILATRPVVPLGLTKK